MAELPECPRCGGTGFVQSGTSQPEGGLDTLVIEWEPCGLCDHGVYVPASRVLIEASNAPT